ncbi:LysR family transcriptional regulator [Serratia sp. Je.1.23.a]|uniref:LysR family transcriptional regulator n=1 Tax=Serratia sp. Je.1.23.a TaxID=3142841 RepID=UPI003DA8B505
MNKLFMPFKAKIDNHAIFRQLEIFIKVVECNSFSVAAQKLNLTPSSVSRSISQLEESLGIVLLKRTTRTLILTEPGKYLLSRAQRLLGDLDDSLINTSSFHQHPQGQLKITCSIAFGVSHLMRLYSEFRALYPDVRLSVDLNDQNVNLNEENFDIALRITARPPNNFAIREVCKINWVYCGSKIYFERRGIPKLLADLEQHDCLINPNVSDNWYYIDEQHQVRALKVNNIIEVNSTLGLLNAALQHQGIVSLPTYLLGDYIARGELLPVLLDHEVKQHEYSLYALYHPGYHQDPKIRSFIDFIVERISSSPAWDKWLGEGGPV